MNQIGQIQSAIDFIEANLDSNIDIAIDVRYESQASFTRAFKQ